jgi:hypothetical protein
MCGPDAGVTLCGILPNGSAVKVSVVVLASYVRRVRMSRSELQGAGVVFNTDRPNGS